MDSAHGNRLNKPYVYFADFNNGYAFRSLIDVIKPNFTESEFEFSESGVRLRGNDPTDSIYIDFSIDSTQIGNYEYRSDAPVEKAGFNVAILRATTTSISKKDGFKIFRYEDDRNLFAQRSSTKKGGSTVTDFIRLIDVVKDQIPDDLPEFEKPNCLIPISEFIELSKSVSSMKCSEITITGYAYGITFECQGNGEISGRKTVFGDCVSKMDQLKRLDLNPRMETDPEAIIEKIKVRNNILKSLSRISNLGSSVQIFVKKGYPFLFRIVGFGVTNVYLKSLESEDPEGEESEQCESEQCELGECELEVTGEDVVTDELVECEFPCDE